MKSRNTYSKGINQDASKLKYPQDAYITAQNFRPVTEDGESTGALENITGNTASFSLVDDGAGDTIIGRTNIRNMTVLFSTDCTGANPGGINENVSASATSAGRIWTVYPESPVPQDTLSLAVDAELNFTSQKPIDAVGRYENADVKKVYWVDELNNMRFANLADGDVGGQDPDQFDIVADVSFEKPVLSSISSGDLNVGVVQYAYQLFNDNGAETTFSPASNLVHLTRSGERLPNSGDYKGSSQLNDVGEVNNSGKSVTMTISNIDTDFDQIRIVAIHYNQINTTPSIKIVVIKPVQENMIFTDDGVYDLGGVSLAVYRLLSQRLFTAKTLETKDNILFAGNITDRFFNVDYDARAYRFNDSQEGRIFEADGVTLEKFIDGTSPLYPTGGTTGAGLDAFNIMNDISLDGARTAGNSYLYQADGARMGGTGPNVSYTFKILEGNRDYDGDPDLILDNIGSGVTGTFYTTIAVQDAEEISYANYASPYNAGTFRGYHRSEIYRFGLVLYGAKGQVSPVKWISDIRMPDVSSEDSENTYYSGLTASGGGWKKDFLTAFLHTDDKTRANALGVTFNVTNLPDDVVDYQIVRVKRESQDRTVLAQGPLWRPYDNGSVWMPLITQAAPLPTGANGISLLYSPEISVNKNLVVGGSDFIEMTMRAGTGAAGPTGAVDIEEEPFVLNTGEGEIEKQRGYIILDTDEYDNRSYDVTDGQIVPVGPTATTYTINSETYTNYVFPANAYGATVLAVNQPDAGWTGASDGYKYTANYRRPVIGYGGASFEDRSINEYISCSDVFTAGNWTNPVYGGDTFIGYFDLHHLMWDLNESEAADSYWKVHYSIVESSINLNLRHDDSFSRVYNVENAYLIQEEAGVHDNGTDEYTQETDLYLYNSAYSQENTSKVYLPLPSGFDTQTKSDALIISSDTKINGELVDSWTKFQENEEIEVDTRYGQVNKLMNFRNHLVFFQDNAIGTVGINQQSLLSSTGNLPELILGKGGVLARYDYITVDSGCQVREAICQSAQGFYWYDTIKNKFYRYSGQLKNISDVEGLFSKFNNQVSLSDDGRSDLFTGTQIVSVFDDKFSEAIYAFKDIRKGVVVFKHGGPPTTTFTVEFRSVDGISASDTVIVDGVEATVASVASGGLEVTFTDAPFYGDYSSGYPIRMYFPGSDYNFTLAYSELMDAFTHFAPYTPESYIKTFGTYLSVNDGADVYEHNRGQKGNFYGAFYPSTVQVLVNPNNDIVNVYNNVELMTEVYNAAGANIVNETISSVRVTNDYQDSGVISLVSGTNIKRRLRKWRFTVPREDRARIRDAYAKMLFSYTNAADKRLVMHDVVTHFLPREL